MSNMKKKKLTTTQLQYDKLVKKIEPKRPIFKNCLKASSWVVSYAPLVKDYICFLSLILISMKKLQLVQL